MIESFLPFFIISKDVWKVTGRNQTAGDDDATIVWRFHDLASMDDHVVTHISFKRLALDTIEKDEERFDTIRGWTIQWKLEALHNTLQEDAAYENEYDTFVNGMS